MLHLFQGERMNNRSEEIIKQLNRLANDRSVASHTRNKARDAINHVRELQLKLSDFMREAELVMNENVGRLETLTSKQRDLIKKLEHENQKLRLQTRALSKRIQDLKETDVVIDRELA